jgi:hypothetical protein
MGEEEEPLFARGGERKPNPHPSFSFLVWREPGRLLELDKFEGISENWDTIFRATCLLDSGTRLMPGWAAVFPYWA